MMEEWVDEYWSDAETQMMTLSGIDFKKIALSPHQERRPEHDESDQDLVGRDTVRSSMSHLPSAPWRDSRRGSMGLRCSRKYSRYAELAKRNSDR